MLHPELIDGAAAMNPHANHLEYDKFQDAIATSFGGSKTDEKAVSEYVKRSAEFFPERITMPLAITVGLNDKIIPPASAIRLAEKIRSQGGKIFLVVREQNGHSTNYEDATAALKFMLSGKVLVRGKKTEVFTNKIITGIPEAENSVTLPLSNSGDFPAGTKTLNR